MMDKKGDKQQGPKGLRRATDRGLSRRQWLATTAGWAAALALGASPASAAEGEGATSSTWWQKMGRHIGQMPSWAAVREQFDASPQWIHMAAMLLATHPQPVQEAIAEYRRELNENPVAAVIAHRVGGAQGLADDAEQWAMAAAGEYLGMDAAHIALTGNTTEGLALVYHGLDIGPDQEVLTAHWNHWATQGSLQYSAQKQGFSIRAVDLGPRAREMSAAAMAEAIVGAVRPSTRVVAATWVHSVTGLKLPISLIGEQLAALNAERAPQDQVIFCVDGVHGFGVEDFEFADLKCDFFVAGCHKWLFGPRGTGIVAATPEAWRLVTPTIPTFSTHATPGRRFTPGGFHAFEHRWALADAFEFHQELGKARIAQRVEALTSALVAGLAEMGHVRLHTPIDRRRRAGIVVFEVDGYTTAQVTGHLRSQGIVASSTPEAVRKPRLSPSLLNDFREVAQVLEAVAALG